MTEETKQETALLLKVDDLKHKFQQLQETIDLMNEYSSDLVVKDDSTLKVAENNSSLIVKTLKAIEEKRKLIKEPYYATSKMIDEYVKTFSKPLQEAKDSINTAIKDYKVVQEAIARKEAEEKRKEIEKEADQKADEVDRMHRIESQLIARIYGGSWLNKNGQQKSSSGCLNKADCKALRAIIEDHVPPSDQFPILEDEYKAMLKRTKSKLSKYEALLIESESNSDAIRENARTEIEMLKTENQVGLNERHSELKGEIINEARSKIKESEKEIKEAGKGVRHILKFEMVELKEVPDAWLMLNETRVREWIAESKENKEMIMDRLKKGENVFEGIKFWVEETYVSR